MIANIIIRALIVGTFFSGKTYVLKKNLKNVLIREFFKAIRSLERRNKKLITENEVGEIGGFKGGFVVYDDM